MYNDHPSSSYSGWNCIHIKASKNKKLDKQPKPLQKKSPTSHIYSKHKHYKIFYLFHAFQIILEAKIKTLNSSDSHSPVFEKKI